MPLTYSFFLESEIYFVHLKEGMEDSNWRLSGDEFKFIYPLHQLHIYSANVLCPNVL